MAFESKNFARVFPTRFIADESLAEQRKRIADEQAKREEHRQAELVELSSTLNAPGERIRLWERLHKLPLPRDPNHNLLEVIAVATDLALTQVQEEQRLRQPAITTGG
jgi:hypothetical protein